MSEESRIVGIARGALSRAEYAAQAQAACREFLGKEFDQARWERFCRLLHYLKVNAADEADYAQLTRLLEGRDEIVRVFFFSTASNLFSVMCDNLAKARVVTAQSRVVLEKPLGHDTASADLINAQVGAAFAERQIYRIDHYLGKETVQNLMALRFGNALFEPLWRRGLIKHVQITVAEELGVERRGNFYDQTGALRDMVQNHLLQLLCIMAMEPPASSDPDAVRDEKLKVLQGAAPVARWRRAHQNGARTVQGGRRARRARPGLSGGGGHRPRQHHRDLRRTQGGDRYLALGGGAVLSSNRQAAAGPHHRARGDVRRRSPSDIRKAARRTPQTSW